MLSCHRPKNSLNQVPQLDLNHRGSDLPPTLRHFANTPSYVEKQYICLHGGYIAAHMSVSLSCQTSYKIEVTEALPAMPKEHIFAHSLG